MSRILELSSVGFSGQSKPFILWVREQEHSKDHILSQRTFLSFQQVLEFWVSRKWHPGFLAVPIKAGKQKSNSKALKESGLISVPKCQPSYSDSKALVIHMRKSCELKGMQIVKLEVVCCCSLTIGTLSYEGCEGTYFIWILWFEFWEPRRPWIICCLHRVNDKLGVGRAEHPKVGMTQWLTWVVTSCHKSGTHAGAAQDTETEADSPGRLLLWCST